MKKTPHTKHAKKDITRSSVAEYVSYVSAVGGKETSVALRYEDENIWMTQKTMALLYGVDVRTVNEHLKNLFSAHELEEQAGIRKFRIPAFVCN
jgi:hypothetical protein